MKIAMTLIVKNEEDIIEENIKFHSNQGIDYFLVIDNGSTDQTYEILKKLSKNYNIQLSQYLGKFEQKKLTTQLTKKAKKLFNPKWIINNDADEFWVSKNYKSIKESLSKIDGSVLWARRYNMIMYEGIKNYKESIYKVVNPIDYKIKPTPNKVFGKLVRKIIINPKGYIKTNSGNHSAEHFIFWQKKDYEDITVYHYPIRSFEQLKKHIKDRVQALKSGVPMGGHIEHWLKLKTEEDFQKEWEKYYFNNCEINCLRKLQIIEKDTKMKELFQKI